jgi:hypothetical protein
LRTCFHLDTHDTAPQLLVPSVCTSDAKHLSCSSRFAVTLRTIPFATSDRITAALYSTLAVTTSTTKQPELRALFERAAILIPLTLTLSLFHAFSFLS